MTDNGSHREISQKEARILESIKPSRIIIPIIIGLVAIGYLMWRQLDLEEFKAVEWTTWVWFWIGLSLILLIIRHLAYAARLKSLAGGTFSWMKSIELIFIWEFSSAVSPTSLGGSVVAFFMLAQEKLSAARTATIVVYTIIIDTIFFIVGIPLLYMMFGPEGIRPGANSFEDLAAWGWTLVILCFAMGAYGAFFYYGMFINPKKLKSALLWVTSFRWLSGWKEKAAELGDDIIVASADIRGKSMSYHLSIMFYTAAAWSCRFLILNCLIIAFVQTTPLDLFNQGMLYARSENMFMIMAFSPTPGGSGLAEIVFGGFLSDFLPLTIAVLVALLWRIITYYVYLIAGVLIVPNWIRKVLNRRRQAT